MSLAVVATFSVAPVVEVVVTPLLVAAVWFWGGLAVYAAIRLERRDAEDWIGRPLPPWPLQPTWFQFLAVVTVWPMVPLVWLASRADRRPPSSIEEVGRRAYRRRIMLEIRDELTGPDSAEEFDSPESGAMKE